MDRASDHAELRNLIGRVARLTDKWESKAEYLENYTTDCVWQLEGLEPYHGHAGLERRLQEVLDQGVCGPGLPMRHHVTSTDIVFDADDAGSATVFSFVLMTVTRGSEVSILWVGEMVDQVVKVGDGWRIRFREGRLVQ